jgi:hypothetical protein
VKTRKRLRVIVVACKSYEQRCEDTKITDKVVTHVEISFYFDKIIFPRGTLIYIFFLIVFLF